MLRDNLELIFEFLGRWRLEWPGTLVNNNSNGFPVLNNLLIVYAAAQLPVSPPTCNQFRAMLRLII